MKKALCILMLMATGYIIAQPITLVKDLNTQEKEHTALNNLTLLGGYMYFTINDVTHGTELWRTDGTAEGTELIKDIQPGPGSGINNFREFHVFNNQFYFIGTTDENGSELWRSDGTDEGTVIVKDINIGAGSSYISDLTVLNDHLYFSAYDAVNGQELWRTDGTPSGTTMVKNMETGSEYSNPANLTVFNNQLYFSATTAEDGNELWRTDGTPEGTFMVKDISPESSGSYPSKLIEFDNQLYFSASTKETGDELWRTDGTESGTVLVKDINTGFLNSKPTNFKTFNKLLYFIATTNEFGEELWRTDGTSNGTLMVKDIYEGKESSSPTEFIEFDNQLYFRAQNVTTGIELWRTDGTSNGTTLLKDINEGKTSSNPQNLATFNNQLYFGANNSLGEIALWRSDGTSIGTTLIKELSSDQTSNYPFNFTKFNDLIYFGASNGTNGTELWLTDGTASNTKMLININKETYSGLSTFRRSAKIVNNALIIRGDDSQLWRTTGTEESTIKLNSNSYSYRFDGLFLNNKFFYGGHEKSNQSLWSTDATVAGTKKIKDVGYNFGVGILNNNLFFTSEDNILSDQLWITDGTSNGTKLLKEINVLQYFGSIVLNNRLLFFVQSPTKGIELWETNGSPNGTLKIKDIPDLQFYHAPIPLKQIGNTIIFAAHNNLDQLVIYKTDGTKQGTQLLNTSNPLGNVAFCPYYFNSSVEFNEKLYFSLFSYSNKNCVLFETDGTDEGTHVSDTSVHFAEDYTKSKSNFYFYSSGKMYRSKGTPETTDTLLSIRYYNSLIPWEYGFFILSPYYLDNELWSYDERTNTVKKIEHPGLRIDTLLAVYNGSLYMVADAGLTGNELYKMEFSSGEIEPDSTKDQLIYANKHTVFIKPSQEITEIKLFDINGRLLYETNARDKQEVTLPNALKGFVIINYQSASNGWQSIKHILE